MNLLKTVLLSISLLCISSLHAKENRYTVDSGSVTYNITGEGNTMGFPLKIKGSSELIFKEFGELELSKEYSVQTVMGQKDETSSMIKYDRGTIYSVDLDEKVIIKMGNSYKPKDPKKSGKNAIESMGAKKVGTGSVLGYECEIWELNGSKIWFYYGVILKSQTKAVGIEQTMIATDAKFNISIADEKFTLPNYPIKTTDEMMNNSSNSDQDDGTASNVIPSQDQIQDMMKSLGNMFGN